MMGRLLAFALALALGACVSSTPVEVSVKTYQVGGTSIAALNAQARRHGPAVPGLEGRAFAAVEYNFFHNFEPEQRGTRCRFNRNGNVLVRSEVTLPEWRERDMRRAGSEVRRQWELLSEYAIIHESGHIRISQQFAARLRDLYRASSAPDCEALMAKIERDAIPILEAEREAQNEFDRTDEVRFRRFLRRNGYDLI
ncbi:MAG: DUF922 domain-containing protein [Pseudomonadota bacterium]